MTTQPTLNELKRLTDAEMQAVNALILKQVESDIALIPQLANHLIASGGKRLRPALTILAAKLCGYEGQRHINLSACVEFIHTATLLHDDVVDESTMRRGNATANDVWGNKASVLVGDFLLSRAFQMMVSDGNLKVLKILSDTSAVIAGGEVLQLSTANDLSTSKDTYLEVITAKTATLFAAACELGAVVSEQEENEEKLRNIGLYLGIAFQLIDDALDYSAVQAELGKTIGDDFREGKVTLPIIIAHEAADDEERLFWQRCIEESNQSREDLKQAMQLLEKHHAIQQTVEEAIRYCDKAAELLNAFENKEAKAAFDETLAFCINRPY